MEGAYSSNTPGMRELQLWEADEGIGSAFKDIEAWAQSCRFSDCTHTHEKGCAVLEALDEDGLT